MRKIIQFALGIILSVLLVTQNSYGQFPISTIWENIANYTTSGRQGPISFVIGNKAYAGSGSYTNDFWEYDPLLDKWTQKANMPGDPRIRAVGFSIGNKGYFGTGQSSSTPTAADFWEYDPLTNTWTQKANIPVGRRQAVGFSIGNKGYVGTGFTSLQAQSTDFWEYDPATNLWTQKTNFPGDARRSAAGFSTGGKGYIGTGRTLAVTTGVKDFWEYDPATNFWSQKADVGGTGRLQALGFGNAAMGYLGTGFPNSDMWEYNPATDIWTLKGYNYNRIEATGFSINNQLYIGLGFDNPTFRKFIDPYYYGLRTSTGDYDEAAANSPTNCYLYPMQYNGNWAGYVECLNNEPSCYAGFGINTTQNLGNLCYRSRLDASAGFRGGYGWYGGTQKEYVSFCKRNHQISFINQPTSPVSLRIMYTRAEIDALINNFNAEFGTSKTYSDLIIIKYSGVSEDLDPANNSTNNNDYTKINPALTFYGNSNEFVFAEFNVSSFSEFYLALAEPQKKFYVNDNSNVGDIFTSAIGNNANPGTTFAPFATINYAISQAQAGDEIYVDAGTYAERIFVNKALTLRGAYTGTNPGTSLNRGASESILIPATENNLSEIITVQVSDVNIDGFLFDGDNPSITGVINLNGVDVNAGMGIYNGNLQTDRLVVKNNIFKNFYRYAMLIQKAVGTPLSAVLVSRNHIDNISSKTGREGRAIGLFSNIYGSITENILTRVYNGVLIANYNTGSSESLNINANIIETYGSGVSAGNITGYTSAFNVNNNIVSVADLSTWNAPGSSTVNTSYGISLGIVSTEAISLSNNSITGTFVGIQSSRSVSPLGVNISGGSVSDCLAIGLFLTGSNVNYSLANINLTNNVVGMDASSIGPNMQLSFSNVAINGGTTGIRFYGNGLNLPGNTFTGVSFTNQSNEYILQTANSFDGQTIDASTALFDGIAPINMTEAQLFATEDKLTHKIDFDNVGYFKLKPNKVYITPNSFAADMHPSWGVATFTPDIKRAIGAAAIGDEIYMASGNYPSNDFTIDKSVSIFGTNHLISPNDATDKLLANTSRNVESIITGGTITIGANNISLQGLTFDPGNKSAIVLSNAAGTNNDFGNINFTKNVLRINNTTNGINQLSIIGKFVTSPAMPITSGYTITDNRFEKSGSATGNTLNFNYVKNISVTDNSFVVTGTTFRTQQAVNLGGSGLVDAFVFSNNLVNEASSAVGGNRIAGAVISGNKIDNTNIAFNNTNTMPQSTYIEFINNSLENTTGGPPLILYNRNATSLAGTSNVLKAENNTMTGIPVSGLSGPSFGSMNFTSSNTVLNTSISINGNKIFYTGDFSLVQSNNIRPISFRGNIPNITIERNELLLVNSGGMLPIQSEAFIANPGITINTEFFGSNMPSNAMVNILNNKVHGFKQSVAFFDANNSINSPYIGYGNIPIGATVNINNNSFTGDSLSINSGETGEIINANCNWYGTAAAHSVITKVTPSTVNYRPWLSNGNDNNIATGFQPVPGSCTGTPVTAVLTLANNVSCFGAANGSINVTISGGVTPYTFAWSKDAATGYSNTEDLTNLSPGIYDLLGTDANGSTATLSATITEPTLIVPVITDNSTACSNIATAAAAGGVAPYNFVWSNNATGSSISNVPAGTYSVTVTDATNCSVTASITLVTKEAFNPSVQTTDVTCYGGANGILTVTNVNGTAPYQYSIDGINYQSSNIFNNLTAGNYTVYVKDANNCSGFTTKTINQPSAILITVDNIQSTCFGVNAGSISISTSGGSPGFSYSWSGPGGFTATSKNISNLAAGNYSLTVTDSKGCIALQNNILVSTTTAINVSATVVNIACKGETNGSITLSVTGGSGNGFTYAWSVPGTSNSIVNLGTGNYNVTITDAGSGCVLTRSYSITQPANTIGLSTTKTNATGCSSMGTITATGSGGTGLYMYRLNSGNYQTSGSFSNLSGGDYTIWVKDANGCTTTKIVTITDNGSDEYENNNSKNKAVQIPIGPVITARIAIASDVDWFKITTPAGVNNYTLSLTHPLASFVFNMYPSANNAAALVPVSSTSTTKQFNLAGATTYYISITGGVSYECYQLSVFQSTLTRSTVGNTEKLIVSAEETNDNFKVKVYSNPTADEFTIQTLSSQTEKILVKVFDINGRMLDINHNLQSGQLYKFGNRYFSGVYFAEITQGKNKKIVKLIKQ